MRWRATLRMIVIKMTRDKVTNANPLLRITHESTVNHSRNTSARPLALHSKGRKGGLLAGRIRGGQQDGLPSSQPTVDNPSQSPCTVSFPTVPNQLRELGTTEERRRVPRQSRSLPITLLRRNTKQTPFPPSSSKQELIPCWVVTHTRQ